MHVTSIVNGVDLGRLSGTIDAVTADPALARFQFRVRNHWIDGGHSRTTIKDFYGAGQEDATRTEPFTVDTDEPLVLLGRNQAPSAGEYVLHALAACLSGTIVYHAAARGIALDGLEATIEGDLDVRGFLGLDSNVRPGYEQIRVTIKAAGDFDDDQLAELASLTRYSPVRDIVSNPVPVAIDVARACAIRTMSARAVPAARTSRSHRSCGHAALRRPVRPEPGPARSPLRRTPRCAPGAVASWNAGPLSLAGRSVEGSRCCAASRHDPYLAAVRPANGKNPRWAVIRVQRRKRR